MLVSFLAQLLVTFACLPNLCLVKFGSKTIDRAHTLGIASVYKSLLSTSVYPRSTSLKIDAFGSSSSKPKPSHGPVVLAVLGGGVLLLPPPAQGRPGTGRDHRLLFSEPHFDATEVSRLLSRSIVSFTYRNKIYMALY